MQFKVDVMYTRTDSYLIIADTVEEAEALAMSGDIDLDSHSEQDDYSLDTVEVS